MIISLLLTSAVFAAVPQGLLKLHELSLNQSEVFRAADARREQADARKSRALGALMPTVTARYNYTEIEPLPGQDSAFRRINQYSTLVNLNQPLYRGASFPAYSFAKIDIEVQTRLKEQAGLGLWLSVAEGYYNLWMATNDLISIKKQREYSDERARELRERVRVGRSRKGELMQAEAQLSAVEAEVSRATSVLEAAQARVDFLAGQTYVTSFERLPDGGEKLAPLGDYLLKAQNRPDVRAQALSVELAERMLSVAKAGHHPSVDFNANYFFMRTGVLADSQWDVGLSISLPLFQGGTVLAETRERSEQKREAVINHERLKREVERDVRILWNNLSALEKVVSELKVAFQKSEATYQENKKDYRYGLVTSLDVLLSLNEYINNKRNYERALLEKELLGLQLKFASGVTL